MTSSPDPDDDAAPDTRPDGLADEAPPSDPPSAGDDGPGNDGPGNDGPGNDQPEDELARQDAIWRAIVENYGERPPVDDTDVEVPATEEPEIEVPGSPRAIIDAEDHDEGAGTFDPEDHFVPPPPPPLPRPEPPRLLAWMGLFGVPTFVLVALVAGLDLPSWLGLLLMVWFVGGFVFLVASMQPGHDGGPDDGARL